MHSLILLSPIAVFLGIAFGAVYIPVLLFISIFFSRLLGRFEKEISAIRLSSKGEALIGRIYFVFHFAVLFLAAWHAAKMSVLTVNSGVILATAALTCGGCGFIVAHSLIHRKHWFDRLLGNTILTSIGYLHFYFHHIKIHHPKVGTKDDPATAKLDQSLYSFWWQSISQNFALTWQLQNPQKSFLPKIFTNLAFWAPISFAIFLCLIYLAWGYPGVCFAAFSAFISITSLETVNYIQHYGLARQQKGTRYEKVSFSTAWNAPERWTNAFIFDLGHHSEHHTNKSIAHLKGEVLPTMPEGFFVGFILAHFPPLWRRLMNKEVFALNQVSTPEKPESQRALVEIANQN